MTDVVINIKSGVLIKEGNTVLNDINIEILKNKINLIIGENGAGKSLLFDVICGIYPLTGGIHNSYVTNDSIVYFPQKPFLPYTLTLTESIEYIHTLMTGGWNKEFTTSLHPSTQRILSKSGDNRSSKCSIGEMKLVLLNTLFLLQKTELFVLDEPTAGLSPSNRTVLQELIDEQISNDKTIIMSTHINEDIKSWFNIIRL